MRVGQLRLADWGSSGSRWALKAGVQPGDRLVRVQDNDGKLPMNAPGREVPVTKADYQESPAGRGCGMAAAPRPAGLRRGVHHGS